MTWGNFSTAYEKSLAGVAEVDIYVVAKDPFTTTYWYDFWFLPLNFVEVFEFVPHFRILQNDEFHRVQAKCQLQVEGFDVTMEQMCLERGKASNRLLEHIESKANGPITSVYVGLPGLRFARTVL